MNTIPHLKLYQAELLAQQVLNELQPHCERIEIAGSIRRKKPMCGDIEIVCIPKIRPVSTGLFVDDFAATILQWPKVRGEPDGRYTQRLYPIDDTHNFKLDIFICEPANWGYIYFIRTGSASFSAWAARRWKKAGYEGQQGQLVRLMDKKVMELREEADLFKLLKIDMHYLDPFNREWM